MRRDLMKELEAWKKKERRKPLLLMGARQVGKTFLLNEFAKTYKTSVYLNFEDQPFLKRLFEESLDPKEILQNIRIETGIEVEPGGTLLIFDEIQECPEALNSLKYFCERASSYHIAAAGSLLGVKLMHTKGFPVGKVDFLHLYPLSFLEFLEGIGKKKLVSHMKEHLTITPLSSLIHDKLLRLFKIYLFVGGMPEPVLHYIESEDFSKVREVQRAILDAYRLDFAKHAPKDMVMKISHVWDAIPAQMAKENKKFIYSLIRKGARAKEYEGAIEWLCEAGLIDKVTNVSTPKLPLRGYAKFDFFKLYLIDTGLLGALSLLPQKVLLDSNALFSEFRGSLIENYVAGELKKNGYGLYYWTSAGRAEVDFVIEHEGIIYPLEVKSGSSKHKKSLLTYKEKYHPPLILRSSPMNLKKDGDLMNFPLYLLGQLKGYLDGKDSL